MYPVLKIMHMLNFLDTFSMGITCKNLKSDYFIKKKSDFSLKKAITNVL